MSDRSGQSRTVSSNLRSCGRCPEADGLAGVAPGPREWLRPPPRGDVNLDCAVRDCDRQMVFHRDLSHPCSQ